jgi:ribosomal protein S18 acetylase RimI-like enzyme
MGREVYHARNRGDKGRIFRASAEAYDAVVAATIRTAHAGDYEAFCRLVPELGVDDPTPSRERFASEMSPRILVAERSEPLPEVVGYVLFEVLSGVAYVRHLVSGPSARRTGVARALLGAVAETAKGRGATRWVLNVKPDNVAAITLYESLGFRKTTRVHAVKIDWAAVVRVAADVPGVAITSLEPDDDRAVETTLGLLAGQLASARSLGGRTFHVARRGETIVGVSVFDPGFPSTYPFKARSPEIAFALLRAARDHAPAEQTFVNMKLDDLEAVKDAILAAGGTLRLEGQALEGALT